jgi:hypothetical protein
MRHTSAYVSIRQHTYISRSSTLDLDVEAQGGGRRVGHESLPLYEVRTHTALGGGRRVGHESLSLRQRRASVVTL